jgi:dolichyldiphosphatase
MAIMTLSPILVVPAYLAVFVFEREFVVLNMLAGQLANEVLSWVLKHHLKQERPYRQYRLERALSLRLVA